MTVYKKIINKINIYLRKYNNINYPNFYYQSITYEYNYLY